MTHTNAPPLRPDPRLPHRDRLLQDGFVAEWVSTHLATDAPLRLDAIERVRARYRVGESLRAVYRLRAGEAEWTVAARMFSPGRSGRVFVEAGRRATAVGPLRGVAHAPEFDTVFWTFPNDRKVHGLALLQAPPPRLAQALGLGRVRTRVVAYAPEKSATAACLAESGRPVAFAKTYAGGEARRVAGIYRQVERALQRTGGGLRVPAVLGRAGLDRTLVLEAITGACLSDLPSHEREGAVAGLGGALASLHALPPPAARFTRLAPARLREAAALIGHVRPDIEALARDLAARLAAAEPATAEPLVRLHGDVHPRNAIVSGGDVSLIDLDQSAAGPAAMDLGSFLAHLGGERVLGTVTSGDERRLARAFLAGYAARREPPAPESLRWHTAAALLAERALRAVNRLRTDGLVRLEALLVRATCVLAGGNHA